MEISIDWASICIVGSRDLKQNIGTGYVFIKNNTIVTAKHVVVDDVNGDIRANLVAQFYGGVTLPLTLWATHRRNDIAILKTEGECPCTRPLMPSHESIVGVKGMFYAGYSPSKSADGIPTINISSIHNYNTHQVERADEKDEIILEFPANYIEPGFSGGPILAEGGSVVGIITQMFSENENPQVFGRATSIENLLAGLEFSINPEIFNFPV